MSRFGFYCFVEDWPEMVAAVIRADAHLRDTDRPVAADLLARAYGQLRQEMTQLGNSMALVGTVDLRRIERQTRVRPDTGRNQLADALFVRHVDPDLLPGAIGIADVEPLDTQVPWWITNELGSRARIGGKPLYGVFYGAAGAGPPDPGQFREHPLFQAGNDSGLAGFGTIREPIPARRFIEKAIPIIDTKWREQFHIIRTHLDQRLELIAKTFE
jgi:hypothetical protein